MAIRLLGRGKRSAREAFDPYDVLRGLSPRLVIDLAHLAGSTIDDLRVTFQVMPWGDRATLAAYGVIDLGDDSSNPDRELKVNDSAVDVVEAAAEVVADAVDPAAVARLLDLTGDAQSPSDDAESAMVDGTLPLVAVSTFAEQRASEGKLVYGIVEDIEESADVNAITVAVKAAGGSVASVSNVRLGAAVEVRVVTPKTFFVTTDSSVVLELTPGSNQPRTIAKGTVD
jgi:hypothetical protein